MSTTENQNSMDHAAQKAILPFDILEQLRVPAAYERSFKVSRGGLLANRYMLAVETNRLQPTELLGICRDMSMPAVYIESFMTNFASANLVALGFEQGRKECRYRLYLEFWDSLHRESKVQIGTTQLLHIGYKWDADSGDPLAVTEYLWHPHISAADILDRLETVYGTKTGSRSLEITKDIVHCAATRTDPRTLIYLEARDRNSEAGGQNSQRASFDINFYTTELRMREIWGALSSMQQHFDLPQQEFERLFSITSDKRFGHLSGGLSQKNEEFFSVYYEV